MLIYFLDLIGTCAFALYGAYVGQTKKLDIFGIITCALISALGGGTLRELFMGDYPPFFNDYWYFLSAILGIILSILLYKKYVKIEKYFLYFDAIGLVTFAYIGAVRADMANLGFVAILFFALITAVGGGIMRDVLVRDLPYILYKDFYATPAVILACLYYVFHSLLVIPLTPYILLLVVFTLRIWAIQNRFELWRPVK